MKKKQIIEVVQGIINDRGVPRNIKTSLESSIEILDNMSSDEEKISHVISILDDASNDHNLSMHTRTNIWNAVSILEELKR